MIKKLLTKMNLTVSALLLIAGFVAAPVAVGAQSNIQENVCTGITNTGADSCEDDGGDASLAGLAKKIINIFSILVGSVSVIMIIIGGFRYVISGGDSNGVSGAKNTIMYAVIGLVIVLFAQIIVKFVLTNTKTTS